MRRPMNFGEDIKVFHPTKGGEEGGASCSSNGREASGEEIHLESLLGVPHQGAGIGPFPQ